jgi:hypothetical protein
MSVFLAGQKRHSHGLGYRQLTGVGCNEAVSQAGLTCSSNPALKLVVIKNPTAATCSGVVGDASIKTALLHS